MRSIGVLVAIARVADGLFDFYPLPVRIQFIRQNERDGSAAAGAHLRAVRHQVDGSVGINSYKHAGMQDGAVGVRTRGCLRGPQGLRNQAHTQDQGASGNQALQKTAAADIQNVVAHTFSPAAALMAARIRW